MRTGFNSGPVLHLDALVGELLACRGEDEAHELAASLEVEVRQRVARHFRVLGLRAQVREQTYK